MSFSSVNMCRVAIAVIFISFVSCVLAETETPKFLKNAKPLCTSIPVVKESKANLMDCFNKTVARHLDPSNISSSGECDFGEKLNSYFSTVKTVCGVEITYNTTDLIKLVDFSLRNESFKKFYADISCVKKLEANISNICVKGKVGFFNITKEKKHTSWYRKANLQYNSHTCSTSKDVKNCVEVYLNTCQADSRQYVASLFEYARELANCTYFEKKAATIPPPSGNGAAAAPLLTIPVIITISIGSVVVVLAIVIIIVIKCKNK